MVVPEEWAEAGPSFATAPLFFASAGSDQSTRVDSGAWISVR